jgi:hypothetical protein
VFLHSSNGSYCSKRQEKEDTLCTQTHAVTISNRLFSFPLPPPQTTKQEIMKTYQPHRTKNVPIKALPPLLRTTIRYLLHRIQSSMIHYQCIQPSPPAHRQLDSFLPEPKVLTQVFG